MFTYLNLVRNCLLASNTSNMADIWHVPCNDNCSIFCCCVRRIPSCLGEILLHSLTSRYFKAWCESDFNTLNRQTVVVLSCFFEHCRIIRISLIEPTTSSGSILARWDLGRSSLFLAFSLCRLFFFSGTRIPLSSIHREKYCETP